ncbi:MAG: hypothetical protein Q7T10_13930 [Rhodoferax sp.]|uniref:hypothetical protein n=1 Tax=Rhodoferax sp. TaxID=50421 RepID=UPI00271E13B5|nr:hypothetical protein [Rhodoferax sp.]MDO8449892.1 hypothetical protein [Rhodoferax sp.]
MAASDALRKSRDAIVDPGDDAPYPLHATMPDFPTYSIVPQQDIENRLWHWDAWVIPYIAVPSLLQPLGFRVAWDKSSATLTVGTAAALTLNRPSLDQFKTELKDVIADAELREDRASEILMQVSDTWSFWATILPVGPGKTPATWRLMTIAQQLALHVEMRFKHELACARPDEYSAQVQPMIRTPGHGSYPMGHMCEAVLTARLLAELTKPRKTMPAWDGLQQQLLKLAERIGENRIVAGLHFQVDLHAGRAVGDWLGNYFSQACQLEITGDIPFQHIEFDPLAPTVPKTGPTVEALLTPNDVLSTLWRAARKEWEWLNA